MAFLAGTGILRGAWLRGLVLALCLAQTGAASGQQVLDRVVARIGREPILLSDVRAAIALGIVSVPAGADPIEAAVEQLIDRRLMLAEVLRFPPPEPDPAAIDAEVARMKAHAGSDFERIAAATGIDERQVRDMARDTLRIEAYLNRRFGETAQVGDEDVRRYFESHPEEFVRDGRPLSFEEAEPLAREAAAAARRRQSVAEWLAGLRSRAEITIVGRP